MEKSWSSESEWTSPGGTTFNFPKPPAFQLFGILEDIRTEIGRILGTSSIQVSLENLATVLLSADKKFVEQLRIDLFRYITFRNKNTSDQVLAGAEDVAFEGDEPAAVYQVLGRALARFFYPSVKEMLSRVTGAAGIPDTKA